MAMNFSLEQLTAFVSAAEQGSFSAAARKLGKVQSVVSTLIANLELDLGVTLFSREGRTPRLTAEGEALLPRAKTILSQCERLTASADSFLLGVEPNLCIAMESLAAPVDLAHVISQLDEEFPEVNLEILFSTAGDVPELVRSGRAQLGVMVQSLSPPEALDFKLLGSFEFWCVAAPMHPLAEVHGIAYDDLALHRQIVVTPRNREEKPHWQISNQIWATDNPNTALEMAEAGIGWSVLPSLLVSSALQSGQLIRLELGFDTDAWDTPIDLVWSSASARGPVSMTLEKLLQSAIEKPT
jgi:DNA-binding transcriptional LysR family regulator